MDTTLDVAIIGGGPAGLTAASTLARQRHTAVVFDSGTYRNAGSSHMHMVLTWDHKDPVEYRKAARNNILANYETIQFADLAVTTIKKSDDLFQVTDSSGKLWKFRKVILAVGSADKYPDLDGYDKLWKKRIFHCLFCKGYEDRGPGSSGVLAISPTVPALAAHMALNAAQLTETVTIYTHGDEAVAAELQPSVNALKASVFSIETRKIRRIFEKQQQNGGHEYKDSATVVVEFEDGASREEKFLVHNPQVTPQGGFVEQLGLGVTPGGDIQADGPFWATTVPGVYAVGDCSTPYKVIPSAISSGCNAAVAAAAEIQAAKYAA